VRARAVFDNDQDQDNGKKRNETAAKLENIFFLVVRIVVQVVEKKFVVVGDTRAVFTTTTRTTKKGVTAHFQSVVRVVAETLKVKAKRARLGGRNAMKQLINGSMSFWNMGFCCCCCCCCCCKRNTRKPGPPPTTTRTTTKKGVTARFHCCLTSKL